MTDSAVQIINSLPGIEGKRYLELGVADRQTFDAIRAEKKTGVDIKDAGDDVYQMTTDEFFMSCDGRFDVVFIDACHDYLQVLRDYNNAAERCDGVVFLHDMVPPTEEYTAQHLCSDSYKLLAGLLETSLRVKVLDIDYGLTAVFRPMPLSPSPDLRELEYSEFRAMSLPLVSMDKMLEAVRSF